MKDIIEFPVVGTRFTEMGFNSIDKLIVGSVLTLSHDKDNLFDHNAIKVLSGTTAIGFIPNKGYSCTGCWAHVGVNDNMCSTCGACWDFIVAGGLATRLLRNQSLTKDYGCYVKEINLLDKFAPIKAKLILE